MQELQIPPNASSAEQASEIIRCWLIDGRLHCSLRADIWNDEPGTWGILLADILNHISDAMGEMSVGVRQEIFSEIKNVLLAELKAPSDQTEGDFL